MANAIDLTLGRHAMALARRKWGERESMLPIAPTLTALMPLVPSCDLQRRWHVVQVEPQQEAEVAKRLHNEGLDTYHPREPKSVKANAIHRRIVTVPMLVGYVFAGFDSRFDPWQIIQTLRGVLRLFMIDERPVPIGEAELSFIRQREAEKFYKLRKLPPLQVEVGDCVQIVEHSGFNGFFGMVVELMAAQHRLAVEVDLFGRKVPIELWANQVQRF